MDRRAFLARSLGLGCSLAASPLVTPVTFAATPGEGRLIVLILRGGMDGLGALPAYGDPEFASLRGALPLGEAVEDYADLDGFFAMHPALRPVLPWWQEGHLAFVQAVSTPYRDKRSHFDGQDILEAGIADLSAGLSRDGWLNRLLQHLPDTGTETAYAVGNDPLSILSGDAPVARWSPDTDLALSPQAIRLAELVMQEDPAMSAALREAFSLAGSDGDALSFDGARGDMMAMVRQDMMASLRNQNHVKLAEFVAKRLRGDARIASFSLNGWDTHQAQDRGLGRALTGLAETLVTLRDTLGGPVWKTTAVVAMTEFGRTVRLNGTRGTDHGTGGAMLLAGGALRGGQVFGDWPGLSEVALYDRRDLLPTRDLRAHAGWLMQGLFGIDRGLIEREVFPGLDLGEDPRLLA